MSPRASLQAWREEVERPEDDIVLERAALVLSRLEYPDLDVAAWLRRLGALAAGARQRLGHGDPVGRLHRLREYLFAEQAFRGNRADYDDPRNSFLSDVLERRLGIPITLSLVLIAVGRRVGLPLHGIGLPGHFVTALPLPESRLLLDPFNGGAVVTPEQCEELVARATGQPRALSPADFAPVTHRQFLARMLANLKRIYWRREAWDRVVAVEDRWLVLDPEAAGEWRDRGWALTRMGDLRRGAADWERYLTCCPDAPDAERVRARLWQVRERLARLN